MQAPITLKLTSSDFSGYPLVPETLGYPGSNSAIRVPVNKKIYIFFFFYLSFFVCTLGVLKIHTATLIHLCVFMETAISIDTLHCNTAVCNRTVVQYWTYSSWFCHLLLCSLASDLQERYAGLQWTHTLYWLTCLLTYFLTYITYLITYLHTYIFTYLLPYLLT